MKKPIFLLTLVVFFFLLATPAFAQSADVGKIQSMIQMFVTCRKPANITFR